jgi:beta-lactamase regulating signal transducer with metallopeptidase domain/biopolymer transport protein ExbD/tetratricopeptide (TPR) repeat protein
MNAILFADLNNAWQLVGWTMIHFLWVGTIIALAALFLRWLFRRASADLRYSLSLASLSLLALSPIAIATYLHAHKDFLNDMSAQAGAVAPQTNDSAPAKRNAATFASTDATHGAKQPENPVIDLRTSQPIQTNTAPVELAPAPRQAVSTPPSQAANAATSELQASQSGARDSLSRAVFAMNNAVRYLPWLWLVGSPLTFAFTATGLVGTRRLRRASQPISEGTLSLLCDRLASSLRITRRITIAICDRIAAPVLVGILRPLILLPPAALTGWSPEEIEMVLLHELAHVRRWDNLVNLLQRVIESLLFFHPAVWLVSNWVRREREACCDALVVARTEHPHAYAELLVALAAQMPRSVLFHPAASSAMAAGPLRSRIRRILGLDDDPMLISGKSFALVLAGLLTAATFAVLYVPTLGEAKQPGNNEKAPSIADALDTFRKTIIGYGLGMDSVLPRSRWTTYNEISLQEFPNRNDWPQVLGHIETNPSKFRVVREESKAPWDFKGAAAFAVPLNWNLITKDYATLLFLKGIEKKANISAESYTSLACFGPMAGNLLFDSYANALIQSDVTGKITAKSYFNLVVTGKLTGQISARSYAMIYLLGGFEGQLELNRSKVYIAGRTDKADLERITGAGQVFIEKSDLPSGQHQFGQLIVTTTDSTVKATEATGNEPAKQQAEAEKAFIKQFWFQLPVKVSDRDAQRIAQDLSKTKGIHAASLGLGSQGKQFLAAKLEVPSGKEPHDRWKMSADGKLSCKIDFVDPGTNLRTTEPGEYENEAIAVAVPERVSAADADRIVKGLLQSQAIDSASIDPGPDGKQLLTLKVFKPANKEPSTAWSKDENGKLHFRIDFTPRRVGLRPPVQLTGNDRPETDQLLQDIGGLNERLNTLRERLRANPADQTLKEAIEETLARIGEKKGRLTREVERAVELETKTQLAQRETVKKPIEARSAGKDANANEPAIEPITLTLKSEDGQSKLYLNNHPVSDDALRDLIANRRGAATDVPVSLRADRGVKYADVMKVVDRLELLGLKKLSLDTSEARNDDWPFGVAFPSPKEGEISARAWKQLGIKVVPAGELERTTENGRAIKVVGGVPLPPGVKEPVFLQSIGSLDEARTEIASFDDLDAALRKTRGKAPIVVKCVFNNQNGATSVEFLAPADAAKNKTDTPSRRGDEKERASADDGQQLLATVPADFMSSDETRAQFFNACAEAERKHLHYEAIPRDGKLLLVGWPVAGLKWPDVLGAPPRKDRVIAEKAFDRLGLKLIPLSNAENEYRSTVGGQGAALIVGGEVPPGLPLPSLLTRIDGNVVDSMDTLLNLVENDSQPLSRCYATADGKEYLFDIAPTPPLGPRTVPNPAAMKPPRAPAAPHRFPSVEDQKLADLAFRRLGLELEPIGAEDLQRVKALGYDGGLKIVARGGASKTPQGDIQAGDILVGLGVWPTTSMKAVTEILQRDDLADLSPLKFYVVREEEVPSDPRGSGGFENVIRTGRIDVNLAATVSANSALPPATSAGSPYARLLEQEDFLRAADNANTALARKLAAQSKRDKAQGKDAIEAAQRELEAANREYEIAKGNFESGRRQREQHQRQITTTSSPVNVSFKTNDSTSSGPPRAIPPVEIQLAERLLNDAADEVFRATKAEQEAQRKHDRAKEQPKDPKDVETTLRELKDAARDLEAALRQFEKAKRNMEALQRPKTANPAPDGHSSTPGSQPTPGLPSTGLPTTSPPIPKVAEGILRVALDEIGEATKAKQEAQKKRAEAKDPKAIEAAKRQIEVADRELERTKRQFEETKRQLDEWERAMRSYISEIDSSATKPRPVAGESPTAPSTAPSGPQDPEIVYAQEDGVIKSVNVDQNQIVHRDDILLELTTLESKQTISIRSPFDGRIITQRLRERLTGRPVNRGEKLLEIIPVYIPGDDVHSSRTKPRPVVAGSPSVAAPALAPLTPPAGPAPTGRAVYASLDGIVRKVNIEHDQIVHRDDVLFELGSPTLEKEIANVGAALKKEQAKPNPAEETVRNLQQQLEKLDTRKKLLVLRSPIDGRVVTSNVRERLLSRPVNRGEMLLEIAPINPASPNKPRPSVAGPSNVTPAQDSPTPATGAPALGPVQTSIDFAFPVTKAPTAIINGVEIPQPNSKPELTYTNQPAQPAYQILPENANTTRNIPKLDKWYHGAKSSDDRNPSKSTAAGTPAAEFDIVTTTRTTPDGKPVFEQHAVPRTGPTRDDSWTPINPGATTTANSNDKVKLTYSPNPGGPAYLPQGTVINQNATPGASNDKTKETTTAEQPTPASNSATSRARERRGKRTDVSLGVYTIPDDLKNDVKDFVDITVGRGLSLWDDKGRLILQAGPERHQQLKDLIAATPKWRDPSAIKDRAAAMFEVRKVDDHDEFEWRTVGLSFSKDPRLGVVVTKVAPGSPGAWKDVQVGDSIANIGNFKVTSLADLDPLIKAHVDTMPKENALTVTVWRRNPDGTTEYIRKYFSLRPEVAKTSESVSESLKNPQTNKSYNYVKIAPGILGKTSKPNLLRYDGKSFDDWCYTWQTELSTAKRTEAVKAIAAFGANGYGPEAAATLMELAGQYDWKSVGNNQSVETLKNACLDAFRGTQLPEKSVVGHKIPVKDAMAEFALAVKSDFVQQKLFLTEVLPWIETPESVSLRLTLSNDKDATIRHNALRSLPNPGSDGYNEKVSARVREALNSKDPEDLVAVMGATLPGFEKPGVRARYPYLDEYSKWIFSPHEAVRKQARNFSNGLRGDDAQRVAEVALAVIKDNSKKDQHIEAIRALAALGPNAKSAVETLRPLVKSDDRPTSIAAILALRRILATADYGKLLYEQFGKPFDLYMERGQLLPSAGKREEFDAFQRAIGDEEMQLFFR